MKSLSSLGLGLSVVFVCLLLALIAEIYYLLWWKRRIIRREIENDYTNPASDYFLYMFCWKKKKPSPSSSLSLVNSSNAPQTHYQEFQFHAQNSNNNKDYLVKPLDENGVLEPGLISGPPRFLFTIKEETKEDLESEDGKSREGKRSSLSELLKNMETPYLTPLSSPPFVTPPITPMGSCHSSQSGGCNYNPFYESSSDAEFSRMVKSSPPPKFKFLRDAEEKLKRKTMLVEEAKKKEANLVKCSGEERQDGSFITVIVTNSNRRESDQPNHHYHSPQSLNPTSSSSSSSQVLPLASSPSTLVPSLTTNSRVP